MGIDVEVERDPGSTLLPIIQQKLKAAMAWTEAERQHLKELSQTYERALQKHMVDQDTSCMQATIEAARARSAEAVEAVNPQDATNADSDEDTAEAAPATSL